MDIFNFFASRDVDVEATIFAENELANVTENRSTDIGVVAEENKTPDVDEIMDDVMFTQIEFRFSKAEIFCMECQLFNPL